MLEFDSDQAGLEHAAFVQSITVGIVDTADSVAFVAEPGDPADGDLDPAHPC